VIRPSARAAAIRSGCHIPREVQGGTFRPGSSGRSPVTWATRLHGAPSVPWLPSLSPLPSGPRRGVSASGGGLDPVPPPNREDETMQDTVDQDAPGADLARSASAARWCRSDPKQDHLMTARAAASTRPTGSPVPGSTPPGAPGPAPAQPAPGRSHTASTTQLPARVPTRARPRTVPGNTTTRAVLRPRHD
jgi:hypothetical protein